jgi:hypothetical protein
MSRLIIAAALSLLSQKAQAAPAHKRPKPVWHGYGFLPGYQQPPSNSQPHYGRQDVASRVARNEKRPC